MPSALRILPYTSSTVFNNRLLLSTGLNQLSEEKVMAVVEFIQRCLDQNYRPLVYCLEDLTPEELSWRPNPHCMSIGFIAWHYGRVMDMWIQERCKGVPQLWEEGWADRMGRSPADHLDNGSRFTEEQLGEFKRAAGGVQGPFVAFAPRLRQGSQR